MNIAPSNLQLCFNLMSIGQHCIHWQSKDTVFYNFKLERSKTQWKQSRCTDPTIPNVSHFCVNPKKWFPELCFLKIKDDKIFLHSNKKNLYYKCPCITTGYHFHPVVIWKKLTTGWHLHPVVIFFQMAPPSGCRFFSNDNRIEVSFGC